MKKYLWIFILMFVIFAGLIALPFFVKKHNISGNTDISQNSQISSDTQSSSQDITVIVEENNNLKQENQKIKDDYDNLKKTYDDLLNKYYEVAPTAFFTFDDGPSVTTEPVLNVLRENNIKATFFVVGTATPFRKKMYKHVADEGHAIGIHSYWHSYKKIYESKESFFDDFNSLDNAIFETTGIRSDIYRFPGGSNNSYLKPDLYTSISTELSARGIKYFDWNVDSGDSRSNTPPKERIIDNVVSGCRYILTQERKAAIILFHDSGAKKTTPDALPQIITELKNMGYRFEPLSKDSYAPHFNIKFV